FNTWSQTMANPFTQLSPRFSASYALSEKLNVNFNIGRYYQLPPYTALGYSNREGLFLNKVNDLKYIRSDHFVAGLELIPEENIQFTLEGFYKDYSRYPFSVRDQVPLSSKSAGYGIFGDEELVSTSDGRAYGFELLGRFKEFKKTNMVFSYTFVRSEFRDRSSSWIPSSWDNRHLFNVTATTQLERNWDIGFKWRFVGGAPFTPYDLELSSLKAAWDLQGEGYLEYSRFNTERLKSFHQLDVRVDKQYFFKGWSLMLYVDVQNLYNHQSDQPSILLRETGLDGQPVTDPEDPDRYSLKFIEGSSGTVLPTIGIIVEF
ncbi:MAG TPA: TonB-dependent receptor, partial [Bacteroidales bacterium]|nr:TonB-dependent receptor [Bacteroidales bacterium]